MKISKIECFALFFFSLIFFLVMVGLLVDYFDEDNLRHYCVPGEPGDLGFPIDDDDFCKLNVMGILKGPVLTSMLCMFVYGTGVFLYLKSKKT